MSPSSQESAAIRVIRFTRRIARQCEPHGPRIPDWVVCDTIANGSRLRVNRLATRGGTIFLFKKTFAGMVKRTGPKPPSITVQVLGEITAKECFALQVLAASKTGQKMWDRPGLFNRSPSK